MALKIAVSPVTDDYSKSWVGTVGETSGTLVNVAVTSLDGTAFTTDVRILPITTTGSDPRALVNNYNLSVPGSLGQAGSALYGIYDPSSSTWGLEQKAQCTSSPAPSIQEWSISNPYGIVTVSTTMYMIDYDPASDKSAHIFSYNMSGDAFSENGTPIYTFVPGNDGSSPTPNQYTAAGTGLDLYGTYLIATFNRYYIDTSGGGWGVYHYGPSALVKIPLSSGTVTTTPAHENTNGLVVEGNFAYVTSYGGAQVADGNASSQLDVFDLSLTTPTLEATLTTTESDELFDGEYTQGDYTDVAFVNGKAYVLLAQYDDNYENYKYAIIQTTATALQNSEFGTTAKSKVGTVTPASPCFALLPGGDNSLYFVDGVNINTINVGIDINATGAIAPIVDAGDFVNGSDAGALFNSAAVVIEKVPTAMALKAGVKRATVTKMAKRIARPEELEERAKK